MVNYPIHIEPDGDGYLVTCPDLPEVTSDGATMEAAFANGADAVDEALAGRLDEFLDIPQPSEGDVTVSVPSLTGLKVMLYWELRDQDLCRADLMEALGWEQNQVDCLFAPRHMTRMDQFDAAFEALGKRVMMKVT